MPFDLKFLQTHAEGMLLLRCECVYKIKSCAHWEFDYQNCIYFCTVIHVSEYLYSKFSVALGFSCLVLLPVLQR